MHKHTQLQLDEIDPGNLETALERTPEQILAGDLWSVCIYESICMCVYEYENAYVYMVKLGCVYLNTFCAESALLLNKKY